MSNQESFTIGKSNPQEPIPGYRLLERIGRGGYGEVWKTLAPGGVPKAIKLIYGDDSLRMVTEMRAINRIKDVRHPFLLSIERIEQCGDLLAIVTELGDKNLQQHFQDYRAKLMPGIPQAELVSMLRDVADVLDYIYQEYALQHLDIKPANLLLFGRRLKVADFGLVKSIYERSASLVHGLTPTYAAPEIFEGQPTRATDQYSLAILYQEMLTGVLPYNGMTAARLATQHLREAPDLSPLPASQRPIIARALSKDPQRRYSSCTELVEELIAATRRSTTAAATSYPESSVEPDVIAKQSAASAAITPLSRPTNSKLAGDTGQKSKPLEKDCKSVPTIVIGIGGLAGKVLQRFRLRIADRQGGIDSLHAFKMLFLDIDHDSLNEINHDQQTWSELETVPTPLRSSAEYRDQGQVHRRWMSRRWLFNVPRNLRTDGLRPFGRLALLSNASRVLGALRSAIQNVTSDSPGTPPRILFVGSISGGTGSGMLPDLAYAARNEVRNAGFPDATIDAILLHSTPVGTGRDKAILNAVAMLSELQHYSEPGSFYPGEPLLQIPPFHGDNKTFASTHFLHLGNDLDGPKYLRAIDNVAEHLYCRVLTGMDQTLNSSGSHTPQGLQMVDLIQVQQFGGYAGSFVYDLARQICVDVISRWCGSDRESGPAGDGTTSAATLLLNAMECSQNVKSQKLIAQSEAQAIACGIDIDPLLKRAEEMLNQELGVSLPDFLKAQIAEAVKAVNEGVPDYEVSGLVIALQDRAIGLDFGERSADNSRNTLFDLLNSRLSSQAMPIASKFVGWVLDLIDQPTFGVDAARRAAEAGRNCIRDLIGALGKQIQERQARLRSLRIQLTTPPGPDGVARTSRGWLTRRAEPRAHLVEKLTELGLSSFEELLEVLVHSQLRVIETNISIIIDELMNMWQELNQLSNRIGKEAADINSDKGLAADYEQFLRKLLLEHRPQLVDELRLRIERDVLTGPKKLQRFVQQRCSYDQEIGDPLCDHARRVVFNRISQILCSALGKNSKEQEKPGLRFDTVLTGILQEPWALKGGEEERAVVIVPDEIKETAFDQWTSPGLPPVSILHARTNNVTVCRERPASTIQDVIQSITHGQEKVAAVAANLHTRIDVDWKSPSYGAQPSADGDSSPDAWAEVSQTVQLT